MKKIKVYGLIVLMLLFAFLTESPAKYKGKRKSGNNKLGKVSTIDPDLSLININNISTWVRKDGFHDWVVAQSWNGAFPNGLNVGAVFAEGVVWGGKVNDGSTPLVRVNGNTYDTGCKALLDRVYRVRPDYKTGDLTRDAATFFGKSLGAVTESDIQQLRDQYEKDWMEWPADEGAIYKDVDGDGQYDPDVDIPGVPGAAQTMFIKYNDAYSASLYGSPPIGLEVSETYWAYAYTGALGNVIYKKMDMVYKGLPTSAANSRIDSMYIVQWVDPDVGNYGDDFAGCDTVLNMGYAYSSSPDDAVFTPLGLAPPAVGYDFLQGVSVYTGNPADSAIFDLKWRKGYKYVNPKPMSSFIYFSAGGAWSDPGFDYNGTLEFYNLMRGKLPDPPYPDAKPFPDDVATFTPYGTYLLDGDPVAGTGKIDGVYEGPSDRRIMVINGPITMNLGDTAQVVLALVGGLGTDNLNSVAKLKSNDNTAQIVFDQLFKLPSIDPPDVKVTELHNHIILNWGENQDRVNKVENFSDQGYTFEGYEIFQLPSPSASIDKEGILLATFDVINGITTVYDTVQDVNGTYIPKLVVDGKDKGIQRYLSITEDAVNKTSLKDGQSYYFAVVAYAVNPQPLLPFHALKSAVNVLEVVPQSPKPGVRYAAVYGDTLKVTRTAGTSDGSVVAIVVDPAALAGMSYEVSFDTVGIDVFWKVTRSDGKVVLDHQTNQNGDASAPIADGIQFLVKGPPLDFTNFEVTANANGPLDPPAGAAADYYGFPGLGRTNIANQQVNGSRWFINSTSADAPDYETFAHRVTQYSGGYGEPDMGFASIVPDDYEIRFTETGSDALIGFGDTLHLGIIHVPFEVWNIADPNDPNDDFQVFVQVLDLNEDGQFDYSGADHGVSSANNDPYTDGIYTIVPLDRTPGTSGYESILAAATADPQGFDDNYVWAFKYPGPPYNSKPGLMRLVFVNWNGGVVPDGPFNALMPETGTVFHIATTKPNTPADKFVVEAPANTNDPNLAKADVEKINVFPNPYYGFHSRENSRDEHYVTFNHLPEEATIRIFDLSGVMVKMIKHDATKGQFDTWDLQNESGYPVASGIYIVHIDMPKLGKTKILKLAVVQEQQILKVY